MSAKRLLFRAQAREKVLRGAAQLADAVVPRAGLAFLRCAPRARSATVLGGLPEHLHPHVLFGVASNSGFDGGVVSDRMRQSTGAQGFDAARGAWVDLDQAGIIDPTKVGRVALENAISAASTLLLTEATRVEIPEKKSPQKSETEME